MVEQEDRVYSSRKFLVTMFGMISAVGLAVYGKLDTHSAMVLIAGIAAYNYANVKASLAAGREPFSSDRYK